MQDADFKYYEGYDDCFWKRPAASQNPDYLRGYADCTAINEVFDVIPMIQVEVENA